MRIAPHPVVTGTPCMATRQPILSFTGSQAATSLIDARPLLKPPRPAPTAFCTGAHRIDFPSSLAPGLVRSFLYDDHCEGGTMGFIETTPVTLDDKVFSTADILAASGLLGADEQLLGRCLASGSLSPGELYAPHTRISLNQQGRIQAAFEQALGDPLLGLRVGRRLHLTSYGIVGFALLSSATLRDALEVAADFGLLINLKLGLRLQASLGQARLGLVDHNGLVRRDEPYWLYLEISKLLTLLRDILGQDFSPQCVDMSLPGSDEQAERIGAILGVPVRLNRAETCIAFAQDWLDNRLPQSNDITHGSCKAACQAQIRETLQKYDLSSRVQNLLLDSSSNIPSLSELAERLHLSPRTLRRRLDALGTSYNALLVEVRKKLAIRYLLNTHLTTEAISEHLNYSDAANFRHAFKRWTGCSPREYRAMNKGGQQPVAFAYGRSRNSHGSHDGAAGIR